jgi:pyrroloquinoline quinone biosynthesis protein B
MIDATPQFPSQLSELSRVDGGTDAGSPEGILLTHAHVGHYAGLLHLGQEVMCGHEVPVWAMPRMAEFLEAHEPWASLVARGHVLLKEMSPKCSVTLGERVTVRPLPVPHRDELSETVAFEIAGVSRRVLWLPDIDGWEGRLTDWVAGMDVAWLDGTFYSDSELPGRQLDQIPHPRISEHLAEYGTLAKESGVDVRLIHLNHSNPVCDPDTPEAHRIVDAGVRVASEGERVEL